MRDSFTQKNGTIASLSDFRGPFLETLNNTSGMKTILSGFVRVLEILESPGILFWHFPGLESSGKLMQVLESPGNL